MAKLSTAKAIEVAFETVLDTFDNETSLLDRVRTYRPGSAEMQNSSNVIWRGVRQHSALQEGWDMTGKETDVIKQFYPSDLGLPQNDIWQLRADDMRDRVFWEERGEEAGKKQLASLNNNIASLIREQGSLFYRSNDVSGFGFISEGQAIQNERQLYKGRRTFILNDRDNKKFGDDLAGRQTLQGRPEATWVSGQIGKNIAEYDIFTGSYTGVLLGGASPDTKTTATLSFKPEPQQLTGSVLTNVDYRLAEIPVVASANYNVGDKITFSGVNSVTLMDKNSTGELMTFTIVAIPDATTIEIYPKPIALDDPGLSIIEASYANVDTQIVLGATVERLNIDASAKANLFFEQDSIEVVGGDAPLHLLNTYAGNFVSSKTKSGQTMYMVYDGSILTMNLTCRCFMWYGLVNRDPSNNGVAVTF